METAVCIVCPDNLIKKLKIDVMCPSKENSVKRTVVYSTADLTNLRDPYVDIRKIYQEVVITWGCPKFDAIEVVPKKIGVIAGTPVPYVDPKVFNFGCTVYTANGRISQSVAEHAIYLALDGLRDGSINKQDGFKNNLTHLGFYGSQIGIIGLGAVGIRIAHIAECFGSDIVYFDPYINVALNKYKATKAIQGLLQKSDIVFICCSLTEETFGLINCSMLEHLKRNAVVVNVARGRIMPDEAILSIAQSRTDIRFRLDVVENESYDNQLFRQPNIRFTSHLAGPIPRDFGFLLMDIMEAMGGGSSQFSNVSCDNNIGSFVKHSKS